MARLRYNNVYGTATGNGSNPITFADGTTTTGTWQSAPSFPTITAPDYAVVIVDEGSANEEITHLTAYTSGATTGTFARGQESTTGVAHSKVAWVHGPTALDYDDGVTSIAGTAGDITASASTGAVTLDLASTAVTPGSYTYSSLTVDAKGRLTSASSGAAPFTSPLTTKGDLHGFSTTDARLPVGTNGYVLQADSTQTLGLGYSTRDANFNGKNVVNMATAIIGTATTPALHGATFSDASTVTISSNVSGGSQGGIFQWDMTGSTYTVTAAQGVTNSGLISVSPTYTLSADTYIMSGLLIVPTFNGTVPPSVSARMVDTTPALNATGTWTEYIGLFSSPSIGAGVTVTDLALIRAGIGTYNGTSTVTTGLDIGVKYTLFGNTIWGITVGNYNSYFQGKTSFGTNAAPTYAVDAVGTIRATNSSTTVAGHIAAMSGTPAAATVLAAYSDSSSFAIGTGASATYASFYAAPTITDAGSAQYLGVRINASSTAAYTGTPIAGDFTFSQKGTGTIPNGYGISASYLSFAGTTSTAYGYTAGVATVGGTITKGIGVGISSSGTITTMVGLDIGVTSALGGSTIWAMQVGNYQSYFNGKTTFGGSSAPSWNVHVQGGNAGTGVGIDISTIAPTAPASNSSGLISIWKGTTNYYLLVTFNDGGTTRYRYMQLNGTTATWTQGTTLPT